MSESTVTPDQIGLPTAIPLPVRTDWRIGMVGFGIIAGDHARAYRAADWKIAAVADPLPEARERARVQAEPDRIYEDYSEIMADPDVDVVALLTHPSLREPVIRAAASAGKHVLTEKPFGSTLAECERMVETAAAAGIHLAVSQNYRFFPSNFYAYHLVRQGYVGKPFFASIEIFGTLDVGLKDNPFYSVCTDFLTVQWNTHLADLIRYWTDRDPRRICCSTRRMEGQNFVSDNLLLSMVDFGPNLTGHILHTELLRSGMSGAPCRVDGDAGSIAFDLWGKSIRISSSQFGDQVLDLSTSQFLPSQCGTMGDLLISIEEGREPLISGRRNLSTMRHVIAEQESSNAGGVWVEV